MPEGDVLFRTAATLQRWLAGRTVTDATTSVEGLPVSRIIGLSVESVEAWGKHLMVRFDSGQTLHSHLRMSGSWHVYLAGDPWRRPERQAKLVLRCGDRVAVCFNAPVVELLAPRAEQVHPALSNLGPDVLDDPLGSEEIVRLARRRPPETTLGDLLLDQTVVAGIGNIYRCEALFLAGLDPETPQSHVGDGELAALVSTAGELMRGNLGPLRSGAPQGRWVYRRSGRPCRRCGTLVQAKRQGAHARTVYWCPTCQRRPEPPPERQG